MIRLAFAQLRHRPLRYLALLLAVVASVALTVAAAAIGLTVQNSVNRTFAAPYEGVESVIEDATEPLPEGVLDLTTTAHLLEEGNLYSTVPVTGITPGPLQWRDIIGGRLPETPTEVAATGAEPPIGAEVTLLINKQPVTATVVGEVTPSATEQLLGSSGLVATNDTIAQWAPNAKGEFRSAEHLDQGVSAAVHVEQLTAEYFSSRNKYFLLLGAFSIVVAIVAALTIYSAMSVIAGARIRESGLVRAIGASSVGIVGSFTVEALVLGILGAALGLPLGRVLARYAATIAGDLGIRVPLTHITVPPVWLAAIGIGAVVVTVVSCLPAAISATRKSALDSIQGATGHTMQVLCGLAVIVCALATWFIEPSGVIRAVAVGGFATLATAAAAAIVIPLILRVRVPLPRLGLALGYASRQWTRSAAVIGIVTVAVALVGAVTSGSTMLRSHFTDVASKQGTIDIAITSLVGDIDEALVDNLRTTPGVAEVAVPLRVAEGFAIDPHAPVLRTPIAPGHVTLPRGTTLSTDLPVVRSNNILPLVDESLVDKPGTHPTVLLRLDGDPVQPLSASDPVRAVAADSPTPVTMSEAFNRRGDIVAMVERLLSITRLMSLVALAIAAVGIAGTVALSWRERAADRRLLTTLGLTHSFSTTGLELVLLIVPAAICGYLVGTWAGEFIATVATT